MRTLLFLLGLSMVVSISAAEELVNHFGYSVDPDLSMAGCVSCHNGQPGKGRDVSRCTNDKMCSIYGMHLVEVKYPPPGKERLYATVEEAAIRGFIFNDGKIFCRTCHSLKISQYEHMLVMESKGEKICKGCHLM